MSILSKTFLIFSLLFATHLAAQTKFVAEADTNRILLGGELRLQLEAALPEDQEVSWPQITDSLGGFEVLEIGEMKSEVRKGIRHLSQDLSLTCFDTGYTFIPELVMKADKKEFRSRAIAIEVVFPEIQDEQAYSDIKAPIEPPTEWWKLILMILGICVLILLIIYLVMRYTGRQTPKISRATKAELPPYDLAMQRLDALRREEVWQKGELKEYYSRLTDIMRAYMEDEFHIRAMESTSEEVIGSLSELRIDQDLRTKVADLFRLSSLVKFAKDKPEERENIEAMDTASAFLMALKPQESEEEHVELSV